jgi:hypothetical protein
VRYAQQYSLMIELVCFIDGRKEAQIEQLKRIRMKQGWDVRKDLEELSAPLCRGDD